MRGSWMSLYLVLVLALGGCAGSMSGGGGSPNRISSEELREIEPEGLSAYEAVRRYRPNWLRTRSSATFGSGGAEQAARVVVDGVPMGEVEDLRALNVSEIEQLEYVGAGDATTRFGTGYVGGAILVQTR